MAERPRSEGNEDLSPTATGWGAGRIVAYSSPLLPTHFISALFTTYYMKYGADVLLLAPTAVGAVLWIARLWEAFCDPLVGFLSDRTQHRMGRRRSWILGSVIPLCIFPIALWVPPSSLDGRMQLAWQVAAALGLVTALSSIQIPQVALGAEMSTSAHDRTRFFATNGVMSALGSFAALAIGIWALRTAADPRDAALRLFVITSIALVAATLWMLARTREPAHHQGRGGASPWAAYVDVLRNPHARILIGVGLFVQITYAGMSTVAVFMLQYVMMLPESTELFMVCYFVPALLSVPVWLALSRRFQKRQLWMLGLVGSAVTYGAMGLMPGGVALAVVLPVAVATGFLGGGFFVFEPSIRAEVIDYDEFETGQRKEGVYSASSQVVGKAAGAIMPMLVGFTLDRAGYVPNVEQSEAVKTAIRVLFGAVPAVAFVAAALLLARFRFTEAVHARIRFALDRRAER